MIKSKLFKIGCLCYLLSACIGSDNTSTGHNVPAHFTPSASSLSIGGKQYLAIKNAGQTAAIIYSATLVNDDNTDDVIDYEDDKHNCKDVTLYGNQQCIIALNINDIEAGVIKIKLDTSIGTYSFPIKISNRINNILALDIDMIKTTKPIAVNLLNNSSKALTLTKLKLVKSDNPTLTLQDISACLDHEIQAHSHCSLIVKASPDGDNIKHTLLANTNNKYLGEQTLLIQAQTNENKLELHIANKTTNNKQAATHLYLNKWKMQNQQNHALMDDTHNLLITHSGDVFLSLRNSGSNELTINNLDINATNIGYIDPARNACINQTLQAGDECDFALHVNDDAYNNATLELMVNKNLDEAFNYQLQIASDYLTIAGSSSNSLHTNTNKTFTLNNKSNFVINVDSFVFDRQFIKIINNNCEGIIKPNNSCDITIASNNNQGSTILAIHEFNHNVIQNITLDINNGVNVAYQNMSSDYYTKLPHDNSKFYQIFEITNNSPDEQIIDLNNPQAAIIKPLTASDLSPSAFLSPNCVLDSGKQLIIKVQALSKCELILSEQNDASIKQLTEDTIDPENNKLTFKLKYDNTADIFTHQYQIKLLTQSVHHDQVHAVGELLSPNANVNPNTCGFANAKATIGWSGRLTNTDVSFGILVTVDSDNKTLKVDSFVDWWKYCHRTASTYFAINNDHSISMLDASHTEVAKQFLPTVSDMAFNYIDYSKSLSFMLMGSNCTDTTCNLTFKIQETDPFFPMSAIAQAYFTRPYPAYDEELIYGISFIDNGVNYKKLS